MKKLLLVGGGHSHALILKRLELNSTLFGSEVEIILINPSATSPYSGMLTGALAGKYKIDDIYIDLKKLCIKTNAKLIIDEASAVFAKSKTVLLKSAKTLMYDILSIDTGSTPQSSDWGTPVKPIGPFIKQIEEIEKKNIKKIKAAVIGGGTSGCEVAACLHSRWKNMGIDLDLTIYEKGNLLIDSTCPSLSSAWFYYLKNIGVNINFNSELQNTSRYDLVVIATSGQAGKWLRDCEGLEFTEAGFLKHNDYMQTNQKEVFVAGDVGLNPKNPVPRAGVYAVRQAPILEHNIRWQLGLVNAPKVYIPQSKFLSLMTDGYGGAFARRGKTYLGHSKLWFWIKDKIDKKFMDQFK